VDSFLIARRPPKRTPLSSYNAFAADYGPLRAIAIGGFCRTLLCVLIKLIADVALAAIVIDRPE